MTTAWRTAAEHRAMGEHVPKRIPDGQVARYVDGTDPDGEPLRRLEARPFSVPMSEYEARERMLLDAIAAWGRAVRDRYPKCGRTVDCGGTCNLFADHRGDCLCDGVEGGEEQCPA